MNVRFFVQLPGSVGYPLKAFASVALPLVEQRRHPLADRLYPARLAGVWIECAADGDEGGIAFAHRSHPAEMRAAAGRFPDQGRSLRPLERQRQMLPR